MRYEDVLEIEKMFRCIKCGSEFEEDDKAFILETGICPYCHEIIDLNNKKINKEKNNE